MAVIQVPFEVPPEIQREVLKGNYRIIGGVVRQARGPQKGQIVKHLKPVAEEGAHQAKNVMQQAVGIAKQNPKIAIAVGVGGGIVALGAGGLAVVKELKKNKKKNKKKTQAVEVKKFNQSLEKYFKALKEQRLTEALIDEVIQALDQIDNHPNSEMLWKQIDAKTMYNLVKSMNEFTMKLSKANNIDVSDELIKSTDNAVLFRANLNAQKKVFREAA